MKKKYLAKILLALIFIILVGGSIFQKQTIRNKYYEVIQMKETIKGLENNLNILKSELSKKDEYITLLQNSVAESNNSENCFDLLYVKVDGKRVGVSTNPNLINEYGLSLDAFCKEIWTGMKLDILEYSKNKGSYNDIVPVKFRVTLGENSLQFNGVAYKSSVNGELVAEYYAGDFGEIKVRYKRGLYLPSNTSVANFMDLMGIGFTFYDDKSIDLHSN